MEVAKGPAPSDPIADNIQKVLEASLKNKSVILGNKDYIVNRSGGRGTESFNVKKL